MKLHCELGDHDWERKSQRGRPPRNCPNHQPSKEKSDKTQTLYCEEGEHKWTRPSQRGKPPTSCPEHKTVHVPNGKDPIEAMKEGREDKSKQRAIHGKQRVRAYRDWVRNDAELRRQYMMGDISLETYNELRPVIPEIPSTYDYELSRKEV